MTTFKGYGSGKRVPWKKRVYHADGTVSDDQRPAKVRTPSVHVQFQPHVTHQINRGTAKKLGLKRLPKGGVYIDSWATQKRYMDHEKHHGRDVGWKDWRKRPRLDSLAQERVW
jgi:hypothetical protein